MDINKDTQKGNDKLLSIPKPLSSQRYAIPTASIGKNIRKAKVSIATNKKFTIHLEKNFELLL